MHEHRRDPRPFSNAPASAATADRAERERIATVQARAALAGWRVEVVPRGFECSRWSRYRLFDSLDEAEAFVAEVTP